MPNKQYTSEEIEQKIAENKERDKELKKMLRKVKAQEKREADRVARIQEQQDALAFYRLAKNLTLDFNGRSSVSAYDYVIELAERERNDNSDNGNNNNNS